MIPTMQTWGALSSIPHMEAESTGKPSPQPWCTAGSCVSMRPQDSYYFIHQTPPLWAPSTPILQTPWELPPRQASPTRVPPS